MVVTKEFPSWLVKACRGIQSEKLFHKEMGRKEKMAYIITVGILNNWVVVGEVGVILIKG